MKLDFPKFAIVHRNSVRAKNLGSILGHFIDSTIDVHKSLKDFFISEKKDYGVTFLDSSFLSLDKPMGLEFVLKQTENLVLLTEKDPQLSDVIRILNAELPVKIIKKPTENSEDFHRFYDDIRQCMNFLREKGRIRIRGSVGVDGGGRVGERLVRSLLANGIETFWYSSSLSKGEYVTQTGQKIGYEEITREMKNRELLRPCYRLEDLFLQSEEVKGNSISDRQKERILRRYAAGREVSSWEKTPSFGPPAIVVFANSARSVAGITPGFDRSSVEFLRTLSEGSGPPLKEVIDARQETGSDALIGIISNPLVRNAYYAYRRGVDPSKISIICPERYRLENLGPTYSNITAIIIGTHDDPLVVAMGLSEEKMFYYGEGDPVMDATLIELSNRLKVMGEGIGLNQYIKGLDPETIVYAGTRSIMNIFQHQKPKDLAYYIPEAETWSMGPEPDVHHQDENHKPTLFIYPPILDKRYQKIVKNPMYLEEMKRRAAPHIQIAEEDLRGESHHKRAG
jgi:hypothetical protein